jgi:hypothetical protein
VGVMHRYLSYHYDIHKNNILPARFYVILFIFSPEEVKINNILISLNKCILKARKKHITGKPAIIVRLDDLLMLAKPKNDFIVPFLKAISRSAAYRDLQDEGHFTIRRPRKDQYEVDLSFNSIIPLRFFVTSNFLSFYRGWYIEEEKSLSDASSCAVVLNESSIAMELEVNESSIAMELEVNESFNTMDEILTKDFESFNPQIIMNPTIKYPNRRKSFSDIKIESQLTFIGDLNRKIKIYLQELYEKVKNDIIQSGYTKDSMFL